MRIIALIAVAIILIPGLIHAEPRTISVNKVASPPVVDGDLKDWGTSGWISLVLKPAVENDKENLAGIVNVEMKTAIADDHFYMAVRWPDKDQNTEYKSWIWKRTKYKRGDKLDDMFAVRFFMDGEYDACMFTEKRFTSDVWVWSAGRSNLAGYAKDTRQVITTKMIEDAAEYELPSGKIVYIKKYNDSGNPIYENTKPKRKKFAGKKLPGIKVTKNASGSIADVHAKGIWKDGYWTLELSRSLDTKNTDDVAFKPGESLMSAIAVYNKGNAEHKSISEELVFEFAK